uniref:Molybdate transporter 1 n=1 Tax=Aegilops tauschii TaxID=37682 RepID=M8BNU8_AEGTA
MATTALSDPEALSGEGGTKQPLSLLERARDNLSFRSAWSELNGAMGDLGTYIPIVLSLALSRHLDLGTTLIFTGIYNAVTGLVYGVPMPVQPMKAIAATALSDPSFDIPEIMAAGILTAAFVLLLGVTRLMKLVYWLVPLPVVRGIQLAQGLNFAMAAVKYIRYEQDLGKGKSAVGKLRPWAGLDGLVLAIAALALGLVLGSSVLRVLASFPVGLLGVLLLFAGVELAIAARDMSSKAEAFVMLVCTAVSLVGSSAALGFLCGMVAHGLLLLRAWTVSSM